MRRPLPSTRSLRAVVLGGAGFVGSHVCRRLRDDGMDVVALDSFITSRPENVATLRAMDGVVLIEADVSEPFDVEGPVDIVLHLASPASPVDYLRYPLETLRASSLGTFHAMALASRKSARMLFASTSEVYGDPLVHPQPESYAGNVDPVGPRSVYDEAKRFGEAAISSAVRSGTLDATIVRIFNTVGPGMRSDDGRMVPAFATRALAGLPLQIHGDGGHTRCVTDVDDTVEGLLRLVRSDHPGPMNIGSEDEHRVLSIAAWCAEAAGVEDPRYEFLPGMQDDPALRRPDITLARSVLGWEPRVPARVAVDRTVAWFAAARDRGVLTA
jgi:nucleoside-diphosphate-sugar epimerase